MCVPPLWSLLFMLPALFLWWFSEVVTLNVPLHAGVFNVECSVGMHTADLETYHPTLWRSSQTFYTGGEPGKQVNTRTSVMLFLFFWSNEDKWSWGTRLGHSNKGSKFAYRKCHWLRFCFFFLLLPAMGKTDKSYQREQLIWSSCSKLRENKADLGVLCWTGDNCAVI